ATTSMAAAPSWSSSAPSSAATRRPARPPRRPSVKPWTRPPTTRAPTTPRRSRAHEPPAAAADPGAAAGRLGGAVLRTPPLRHVAAADRGLEFDGGDAGRGRAAGQQRQRRRNRGLPAGRLALAAGHRADGRPAVGADAAGRPAAGGGLPAARLRRLGPARAALPCVLPVPDDGPERRLPHRRRVQPVRVLRSAADLLLRADA